MAWRLFCKQTIDDARSTKTLPEGWGGKLKVRLCLGVPRRSKRFSQTGGIVCCLSGAFLHPRRRKTPPWWSLSHRRRGGRTRRTGSTGPPPEAALCTWPSPTGRWRRASRRRSWCGPRRAPRPPLEFWSSWSRCAGWRDSREGTSTSPGYRLPPQSSPLPPASARRRSGSGRPAAPRWWSRCTWPGSPRAAREPSPRPAGCCPRWGRRRSWSRRRTRRAVRRSRRGTSSAPRISGNSWRWWSAVGGETNIRTNQRMTCSFVCTEARFVLIFAPTQVSRYGAVSTPVGGGEAEVNALHENTSPGLCKNQASVCRHKDDLFIAEKPACEPPELCSGEGRGASRLCS